MKSKIRKIVIHSKQYIWTVSEKEWHTVTIKVWMDGHKRNHWFEVLKEFDDPWINFKELASGQLKQTNEGSTPVTPKLISELIKVATDMNLHLSNSPHKLMLNEGNLVLEKTDV